VGQGGRHRDQRLGLLGPLPRRCGPARLAQVLQDHEQPLLVVAAPGHGRGLHPHRDVLPLLIGEQAFAAVWSLMAHQPREPLDPFVGEGQAPIAEDLRQVVDLRAAGQGALQQPPASDRLADALVLAGRRRPSGPATGARRG
jgi:hypothetical protein